MKYIANPVEVEAHVITEVYCPELSYGVYHLKLDNGADFRPDGSMTSRMKPQVGDYVVKQADGYIYLNPKEVFERKYTPASFGGS